MRSAVSMGFGIDGGKGSLSWDAKTGHGNPSLSLVLARYFRGLHRRKVSCSIIWRSIHQLIDTRFKFTGRFPPVPGQSQQCVFLYLELDMRKHKILF